MVLDSMIERVGGVYPIGGSEFEPLSADEMAELEKKLKTTFPPNYRQLLGTYGAIGFNGTSEDDPYVYFESTEPLPEYITSEPQALIRAFYGRDIHDYLQMFRGRMPDTLIPIAHDGGAGQLCLGIAADDLGKVYYWDMSDEPLDDEEFEEDYGYPKPPEEDRKNLYLVANTFDDFLNTLRPSDTDE